MSIINAGKPVQSDWSESDTSDPSYIQNKPSIPSGTQLVPPADQMNLGNVLRVSGSMIPAWGTVSEVPSCTSSDVGKLLTVNSQGTAAWGRRIVISSSDPFGGSDGDIWFKYEA